MGNLSMDEKQRAEELIDAFTEFAHSSCEQRAVMDALINKADIFNNTAASFEHKHADTAETVNYIYDTVMAMSRAAAESEVCGEEIVIRQVEIFNKYMCIYAVRAHALKCCSGECIEVVSETSGELIRRYGAKESDKEKE